MFNNAKESCDVELSATIIILLRRIAAKDEHVEVFRLVDVSTIEKKKMHENISYWLNYLKVENVEWKHICDVNVRFFRTESKFEMNPLKESPSPMTSFAKQLKHKIHKNLFKMLYLIETFQFRLKIGYKLEKK